MTERTYEKQLKNNKEVNNETRRGRNRTDLPI
jgi:hypothetical protein